MRSGSRSDTTVRAEALLTFRVWRVPCSEKTPQCWHFWNEHADDAPYIIKSVRRERGFLMSAFSAFKNSSEDFLARKLLLGRCHACSTNHYFQSARKSPPNAVVCALWMRSVTLWHLVSQQQQQQLDRVPAHPIPFQLRLAQFTEQQARRTAAAPQSVHVLVYTRLAPLRTNNTDSPGSSCVWAAFAFPRVSFFLLQSLTADTVACACASIEKNCEWSPIITKFLSPLHLFKANYIVVIHLLPAKRHVLRSGYKKKIGEIKTLSPFSFIVSLFLSMFGCFCVDLLSIAYIKH